MRTEGRAYWSGVQMDETALPILLVDLARREGALREGDLGASGLWPMVRRAASFLVRNGPVTQQDRWEEDGGYTPFTLAAEIAALLVASDLAELVGEPALAPYLRETADAWNDRIDRWLHVRGGELAARVRLEVPAPATVRWSADGWRTVLDEPTRDTGLGVHVADLPTETLSQGAEIVFTFHWPKSDRWEETDFSVRVHEGSWAGMESIPGKMAGKSGAS